MALMQMRKPRQLSRLPSTVYADNYGYTINFYQPMVDYLDAKQHGEKPQLPHLPWTNERGLRDYRPSKLYRTYSDEEINRLSRAAAARAEQDLINSRIVIRSPFSVVKSADAARVIRHLRPDTVEERAKRRQEQREEDLRQETRREIQRFLRAKRRMDEAKEIHISDELKRAIRGKSASAISAALLADSEKNMKAVRREEEELVTQTLARTSRATSESRLTRTVHVELMDERMIDHLDHKVSSSLVNVKRHISNLTQKTNEFYADSRCAPRPNRSSMKPAINSSYTPRSTSTPGACRTLGFPITRIIHTRHPCTITYSTLLYTRPRTSMIPRYKGYFARY